MIIQEIKQNTGFFFSKKELQIKTDEGKNSLKISLTKEQAKELNRKLAGTKIDSLEELENIKNDIKSITKEYTDEIQLGIINASKNGWAIINKNTRQVPRPIYSIIKKEEGIKEFLLLSLNTKNFDTTIRTFAEIESKIKKTISEKILSDEEIISIIKEAIDEAYKELDFEIRIGAVFNNYMNGKYLYKDKQLTEEEQIRYLQKLIDTYDLLYLENPFYENSTATYKKFTEEHKNICLIVLNSRINDYTKALNEKTCNTIYYEYDNLEDFKINIPNIKDNNFNIIIQGDPKLVNLAAGFMIPLIKLDKTNTNEITRAITQTTHTIQEYVINHKPE